MYPKFTKKIIRQHPLELSVILNVSKWLTAQSPVVVPELSLMVHRTLTGVHFVKAPEYVQVTGVGNFTKINIPKGDAGGELDNRGADGMS